MAGYASSDIVYIEETAVQLNRMSPRTESKYENGSNSVGHDLDRKQDAISSPSPPLLDAPRDYLRYSICVTVIFFPIGITAIRSALECRRAVALRNKDIAELRSNEAKSRSHLALLMGIATWIVVAAFIVVGVL